MKNRLLSVLIVILIHFLFSAIKVYAGIDVTGSMSLFETEYLNYIVYGLLTAGIAIKLTDIIMNDDRSPKGLLKLLIPVNVIVFTVMLRAPDQIAVVNNIALAVTIIWVGGVLIPGLMNGYLALDNHGVLARINTMLIQLCVLGVALIVIYYFGEAATTWVEANTELALTYALSVVVLLAIMSLMSRALMGGAGYLTFYHGQAVRGSVSGCGSDDPARSTLSREDGPNPMI